MLRNQFRFQFGQRIKAPGITEEGHSYVDEGFVIGLCVTIPGALIPGNWYLIQWTSLPVDHHLGPGHIDWEHEANLEA